MSNKVNSNLQQRVFLFAWSFSSLDAHQHATLQHQLLIYSITCDLEAVMHYIVHKILYSVLLLFIKLTRYLFQCKADLILCQHG